MGFIGVLGEKPSQARFAQFRQQSGRGPASCRVHPHVEGAVDLEAEAARGVVDLHGGKTEIREQQVRPFGCLGGEEPRQRREIHASQDDRFGRKTEAAESGLGPGQLDRIGIHADQPPAWLDGGEQGAGMTAVSQRAIDGDISRPGREHAEDLGHHDRPVRSGRRLAAGDHLRHFVGIAVGLVLLVFLVEMPRILAAITRPTPRLLGVGRSAWRPEHS